MLLFLALVAIIIGCLCLWFETKDYGSPPFKDAPQVLLERDLPAIALVNAWRWPAADGPDGLMAGRFLERAA
jgi:hypothetical protein